MSPRGVAVGGGIGVVLIAIVVTLLGGDPGAILNQVGTDTAPRQQQQREFTPEEQEKKQFVAVVLASTEDVWSDIFKSRGNHYEVPKLVLFTGEVQSACGFAGAAVGPFYCPGDSQVYLDLSFFTELQNRFGAPGEFAQAYVIAHEIGHHVQNLLGISDRLETARGQMSQQEFNRLSVRLELQADFLAGVWAHHAQKRKSMLDPQDIEDGLRAASAIGDDKLQMESQGRVVPDAFTHGTSQQRVRWFRKGWETGDVRQGDTFRARDL